MPPLKPGTIWPTLEEEAAINAGIAADPDNPELTDEDFARMRPAMEFEHVRRLVREQEEARRRAAAGKTRVTIRLDSDIVACLREGGPGWQTRANDMLRHAVLGA